MKTAQQICAELKGIDGALGAAVLRNSRCIASSLPQVYAGERVDAVANCVLRLQRLVKKAGYAAPTLVLQFERTSIYSWYADSQTALAVFCLPTASVAMIELTAELALDDLKQTLSLWPAST